MNNPQPPLATNTRKLARRRSSRRAVNYYLKFAGLITSGALGAYLVFAFIMKVVHPYQMGFAVERDITVARAELDRQNAKNSELERRLAYLKTPEGAETEARRAGFSRPGELVYLLRTDTKNTNRTSASE